MHGFEKKTRGRHGFLFGALLCSLMACGEVPNDGGPPDLATPDLNKVSDPFADRVVSYRPGEAAGFGQNHLPQVVLGAPDGGGPSQSGLDVLSLGRGGEIILEFLDIGLVDGPGPDLLVFENPFIGWIETGVVAVSEDGQNFFEWPCMAKDPAKKFPGCAGVNPVLSSKENGISATDPKQAGGDAFDLADLGISRARFVRIRDSGENSYTGVSGGFDLDAVAVVNGAPIGTSSGPLFLDPKSYADDIKIDAAFPFGVTRRYTTMRRIRGARWGRHGGPMLTGDVMISGMPRLGVTRFSLPAAATGELSVEDSPITEASGLPMALYYNAMVDLPLDGAALLSYTGPVAHYQGEALLYSADYTTTRSRAFCNGLYDVASPSAGLLFHTSLSGFSATPLATEENGLWRSELCNGQVVPTGTCAPSRKLIGWDGYSGPVVTDVAGNIFVAASLSAGPATDEVYALSRAESTSAGAVTAATLLSLSTNGTSTIAAIAPAADHPGWLLHKGYDAPTAAEPATAQAYMLSGGHLQAHGATIASALQPGSAATGFSLMTDVQGTLWIAVSQKMQNVLLELRPLPK